MAQAAVQGVRFMPIAHLEHPTVGVLAWHEEGTNPALQAFLDVASAASQQHRPASEGS